MKVLPAVDIVRGKAAPEGPRVHPSLAAKVARHWVGKGATALHVVDIDGAMDQGGNPAVIQQLLRSAGAEVQVGGGMRTREDVATAFRWGAVRVIVGTKAVEDRPWLAALAREFRGKVMVALDVRQGEVMTHGWAKGSGIAVGELLRVLSSLPLAGLLYTDLDVEGRGAGVRREATASILEATSHPVYVAGGVARLEDIALLRDLGAAGAVLGSALYSGLLSLEGAMEVARG